MNRFMNLLALVLGFVVLSLPASAGVIYVDTDAASANDGSSWTDAFVDLKDALGAAQDGDEIWVAEGTYLPSQSQDIEESFWLASGVEVYGGFAGDEVDRASRDWEQNSTILSGDLESAITQGVARRPSTETSTISEFIRTQHVVRADGVDGTAILDGFTITRGHAQSEGGGGILLHASSPLLVNLRVVGNSTFQDGAGLAAMNGSSPELRGVSFESNNAVGTYGGGLLVWDGSAKLSDVAFSGNIARIEGGGAAIMNPTGIVEMSNVSFIENSGDDYAGGLLFNEWSGGGSLILRNGLFHGNRSGQGYGSGFEVFGGSAMLINVLFTENSSEQHPTSTVYNSGNLVMVNVGLFANQHVGGYERGGAIYSNGGSISLINVSVASNDLDWGPSGGLHIEAGTVSMRNSLFWGNTGEGSLGSISIESGSLTIANSLVQGCGASGVAWDTSCGDDSGGNLDAEPMFVNLSQGDYRLRAGSPAIDAGDDSAFPSSVVEDLSGSPRIFGASVDMGAYEYQGIVPTNVRSLADLKALFGDGDH